jgi:hypothetical protein
MSENKKFVGQPILSQILHCINFSDLNALSRKHKSDRYYKRLPVRKHLTCLLYGVFSYCNGLRDLCEGLLGSEGKLTHLGLDPSPARSTLSDANRNLSYLVFEDLYFRLVGRNPMDDSRKKGGIKVHTMMDAFSGGEYMNITAAQVHDRKFLYQLQLAKLVFLVFDKAYNHYKQFARWTEEKIWFVARMKTNAVFHVTKVLQDKTKMKNPRGVLKEQYVTVGYKEEKLEQRLKLRRIIFKAEDGKKYVFITNNMSLKSTEIANIYKYRWMIELLFKQIK